MLTLLKTSTISKNMTPRNILSLTREEKLKFLNSFDYVFSDIDGVIWNITHTIEGSADGIKKLREAGKKVTFITNNSVRSELQCLEKLRNHNIDVESKDVMHPAKSMVEYLNSIHFEGLIYILASEGFKKVISEAGYKLLEGPNVILKESFTETLRLAEEPQPVKAVIIDYDFNLSFLKIMKATFYLRQPDCILMGGATDFLLPTGKNTTILGPGPFLQMLEQVSQKEMLTFGKPGKALAEVLMQRYHILSPDRVLMIGDMLEQDVRFATVCGFQSLLVLSGCCSYDQLMAQTDANLTPHYYAQSVADFVEFMQDFY